MIALSPEEVCAGYLDQCGSDYNPFNQTWNISVPGNKPTYKPLPTPLVCGSLAFVRGYGLQTVRHDWCVGHKPTYGRGLLTGLCPLNYFSMHNLLVVCGARESVLITGVA